MNSKLLPTLLIISFFTSCTAAYKTGQTPDDVYYSPARPLQYDSIRTNKDDQVAYHGSDDSYILVPNSSRRWRSNYYYERGCYPYGTVFYDVKTGKSTPYTATRKINTGGYKKQPSYVDAKTGKTSPASTSSTRTFKSANSGNTGVGNILRSIFNGSNSSSSTDGSSNNKTLGGSSGGSSSKSSTSAPVRTFGK